MPAHHLGVHWRALARTLPWLLLLCALAASGCANGGLPRIDPTGERLLVPGNAPPPPAVPGAVGQWGISVSPNQVIAPVGSEVVMLATVMGPEGFPLTREKVEWILAPGGVGQFVSPGVRRPLEVLNWLRRLPRKVDNTYVINTTLAGGTTLDRGTPTPSDDIIVQSGQAWVSVTSPNEGTSHLTVVAPDVDGWDRRQQSASIYWVDAQWRLPPPAISTAGTRNSLSTVVTRQTDNSPLPGWVVRYEIAGGPQAGFAPGGATAVEVVTGPTGEAPAEIVQQQAAPGTNQINIQIISPASPAGANRQLPVGSGATLQTWTSGEASLPATTLPPTTVVPSQPPVVPPTLTPPPSTTIPPTTTPPATTPPPAGAAQLEVTVSGPDTAVVGSDVQFQIQVVNRGTTAASKILVSDRFDEGLEHAAATGLIERDLVDLPPGGQSRLAVSFHISRAGQLCQNVTVTAAGDARATTRSCITAVAAPVTAAPEPRPLEPSPDETPARSTAKLSVTKKGPDRRKVGEVALFIIEVTNTGDAAIENLEIADNFETSLEPGRATEGSEWLEGNALGWKIDSLAAGRTVRREIELKCLRETPRSCNRVTVTAPGLEPVADEACLEIVGEGAQAPPGQGVKLDVSIAETADPIKIDGPTTYQVILTNKGDQPAFDVEVSIKHSDELRLQEYKGPVRGSATAGAVRFPPIRELRAGESQTFELRCTGLRPGTARVQAEVTGRDLPKPITAEQTTEVLR